jgi:hypothetical protein
MLHGGRCKVAQRHRGGLQPTFSQMSAATYTPILIECFLVSGVPFSGVDEYVEHNNTTHMMHYSRGYIRQLLH